MDFSEDAKRGAIPASGDDILDWLRTPTARARAARYVHLRRLPGGDALIDDLLSEATLAVLGRMQSPRPLVVESAAKYGTAVIRSCVRRMVRGRDVPLEEILELAELVPEFEDPLAGDNVRTVLETMGTAEPWLASASLSTLVYLMHPSVLPEDLPSPKAGANAAQARCWPALWLAGEREVFPNGKGDPQRRTRARRIEKVQARLEQAYARLVLRSEARSVR